MEGIVNEFLADVLILVYVPKGNKNALRRNCSNVYFILFTEGVVNEFVELVVILGYVSRGEKFLNKQERSCIIFLKIQL